MQSPPTPGRFVRPETLLSDGVITLRPFSFDDALIVTEHCQDPEIPKWTTVPSPYTLETARHWIGAHDQQWANGLEASLAIIDASSDELIGSVGLYRDLKDATTAEVGYWVARAARGRGVAVRATNLIIEWGSEVAQLENLRLVSLLGNTASERVAAKCGFERVGEVLDYRSERRPCDGADVTLWRREAPRRRD
jgi:RimJ/RimL family protein N-acetyltransferase